MAIDYNDWLPKSSTAARQIDTKPRKYWNYNKDKPFEFRGCMYCFDRASFICPHCNVHFCAGEECKEFHENEHIMARLGSGHEDD